MGRSAIAVTPGFGSAHIGADYTDEEREFMMALDRYKREQRRPHPTCREILQVLVAIGWRKCEAD